MTGDTLIDTPDFANFGCLGQVTDGRGEVRPIGPSYFSTRALLVDILIL